MATDNSKNILFNSQLLVKSIIGQLRLTSGWLAHADKTPQSMHSIPGQEGPTVYYLRQFQFDSQDTLDVEENAQNMVVRTFEFSIDQKVSVPVSYSYEQIFNGQVMPFMEYIGKSLVEAGSARVEKYIANRVGTDITKFYGNGVDKIDNLQTLSRIKNRLKDFGATEQGSFIVYPETMMDTLAQNSLQYSFAPKRNDQIASTWDVPYIGNVPIVTPSAIMPWYSGVLGNTTDNKVFLSNITRNTSGAITHLTLSKCSGVTVSGSGTVKVGDLFQTVDAGVSGAADVKFKKFNGDLSSQWPFQFKSNSAINIGGGASFTMELAEPIIDSVAKTTDPRQVVTISRDLLVSATEASADKFTCMPNHRKCAIVMSKGLLAAMPALNNYNPTDGTRSVITDPESNISMTLARKLYAMKNSGMTSVFGIYDARFVNDTCAQILMPLTDPAIVTGT